MLTQIIFTTHGRLAAVNLQVITDGNQTPDPSAVCGSSDYLQVLNLILCLRLVNELYQTATSGCAVYGFPMEEESVSFKVWST